MTAPGGKADVQGINTRSHLTFLAGVDPEGYIHIVDVRRGRWDTEAVLKP